MKHWKSIDFSVSRIKISSQIRTRTSQPSILKRVGEGEKETKEVDMRILSSHLKKKKKDYIWDFYSPPFIPALTLVLPGS